ncbi:MAG: GNAT family N-acetyltransferase [Kiloniellales bacterium]|nr:GNAT family N-acetyltransferase [Kiloniellales bacterium]
MEEIEIRSARAEEAPAISALVLAVFEACVAPHYGAEGRATFGHEAAPEAMAARLAARSDEDRRALVACTRAGDLVGYLEVEKSHIRELFVAGPFQRQGIAGALLARAFEDREEAEVTVNAAPNSVKAYARLGFVPAGPWTTINGLTYQPMVRRGAPAKPR